MQFKKIVAVMAAYAIAMTSIVASASAEEKNVVLIPDLENDAMQIEITNNNFDGKQVSFYLFKPGKGLEDIKADGGESAKNSIYQTLVFDFSGEKKNLNVKMKASENGSHTYEYLIIAQDGEKLSGNFDYYTQEEKNALISEINAAKENGSVPENLAERVYKFFNLDAFELYSSLSDKDRISKLIMKICNDKTAEKSNIADIFKEACVVEAFSEGSAKLMKDGNFIYIDYIGLNEKYLTYYNDNMNDIGRKNSVESIFGEEYTNIAEIKGNMEKQIIVNSLNDNKLSGYGHIENVISDFKDELVAAGFDVDKYNKGNKNSYGKKYMEQISTSVNTIEKAAKLLNSVMKESSGSSSSGSGNGGSSGSSSKKNNSNGLVIAPVTGTQTENEIKTPEEVIFSDLNGYDWASESIKSLFKKGIISGKNKSEFAPGDNITREEFTVMLVKAFELKEATAKKVFEDVSADRWSYEYIYYAYSANIISGDGENFRPNENITRQDIAAILLRMFMNKNLITDIKPKEGVFNDENDISLYALESVQIMNSMGILNGDDNGHFRPKDNATRAETAVIIARALNLL